ncbi:MAG: class I SAM-dependent methyltransferase [Methylovirgula sp.]
MEADRQTHWDNVYAAKAETEVSWFQESPTASLDLIHSLAASRQTSIIDIGGGASRLVDALLDEGFESVSVLDLSENALAVAKARLGARAQKARWIAADVTTWAPAEAYDLWHDRAAFHFLTEAADRAAYRERVVEAVRPGGHVIIATFAPDGPERCSGLPIIRHDVDSIAAVLGAGFEPIEMRRHEHATPGGSVQRFQFSCFQRRA